MQGAGASGDVREHEAIVGIRAIPCGSYHERMANTPSGSDGRDSGSGLRRAPLSGDVTSRRTVVRDEDEFDESPQAADIERFSDVTRSCPECNKEVFDDSAVCYHCGHAFERTTAGSSKTPAWVMITVVVLVAAMALGLWRLF